MAQTSTPTTPGVPTVQMGLSRAHFQILSEEAKRMRLHRNQLLGHLLQRKLGLMQLERPSNSPTYDFQEEDLEAVERYAWSITPEEKQLLDRDCLAMGNIPYSSWVTFVLNEWIGRPRGLL